MWSIALFWILSGRNSRKEKKSNFWNVLLEKNAESKISNKISNKETFKKLERKTTLEKYIQQKQQLRGP